MYAFQTLQFRNSSFDFKSRLTMIFEKKGQEWKIVHEHWSVVDPRSVVSLLYENGKLVLKR
jgi:hypothetical protein